MNDAEQNAIRKVWHEHAKSRFNVRKGYLVVPVEVLPPDSGIDLTDLRSYSLDLGFRLEFEETEYVVRCEGVEVERGPVSDVLRACYGGGTQ